jgi:pseudaminic acid biosynthesis-associated methylase
VKTTTVQAKEWSGEFGREYTDRNPHSAEEVDALYLANFGVTRTALNLEFMGHLDRSLKILETGANVGAQLHALQKIGFTNLYGLEIQAYAIRAARALVPNAHLVEGSVFNIPYPDNFFDLVFTSGLLIHIAPADIGCALDEIHRCARRYIWGMEYYHDDYVSAPYRGKANLMWKANFAQVYLERFSDLMPSHEKRLTYLNSANVDAMFLLQKR